MYQKTSNSIYLIKYHIILTVKYRKQLMNKYGTFIIYIINELTKYHKFTVDNINHDNDHIHILISARPDISPSQIVKVIKQQTSYELWNNFKSELSKQFYKKHIFWSRSSFINSIGEINEEIINNYINIQGESSRLSVSLKT